MLELLRFLSQLDIGGLSRLMLAGIFVDLLCLPWFALVIALVDKLVLSKSRQATNKDKPSATIEGWNQPL